MDDHTAPSTVSDYSFLVLIDEDDVVITTINSTAFDRSPFFDPNVESPAHEQTSKMLSSRKLEAVTNRCIVMGIAFCNSY